MDCGEYNFHRSLFLEGARYHRSVIYSIFHHRNIRLFQVEKNDAFTFTKRLAAEEGILAGISTGASLAAVNKKLAEIPAGAKVLTFNYDTGERYWSVEGLFEENLYKG